MMRSESQQRNRAIDTPVVVWLVLLVVTAATWLLGIEEGRSPAAAIGLLVIALAFTKIWLVGMYFMELRGAPRGLRAAFHAYTAIVGAAVAGLYLLQ